MAKLPSLLTVDASAAKEQVSELLEKKLPHADYLGGPSVRGWSKIKNYMVCDRLYYLDGIRKMRPKEASPALEIGTLFHACMAAHYSSGGTKTFEPLQAIWDEHPALGQEVARLLAAYFQEYAEQERDEWDIRAIENEVVGSMASTPFWLGAPHSAPVSCRFDLVIRKKTKGTPPDPYGPCPDGVYIVDHKVFSRLSRDLTEGYMMDGQFLLMAYLWKQQKLDAVFGKLNGFIINIITKTNNPECKRLDVAIDDNDVKRFEETIAPVVVEMDLRIKSETAKDEQNWPMNFAVCKSPFGFGLCKFWSYCVSHGTQEALYSIKSWTPPPSAK